MILNKKSKFNKKWMLLSLALLAVPLYSRAGDWLWTIDKTEYSANDFARDYTSYLNLMSLQMETSPEVLLSYIENADKITDTRLLTMVEQFRPSTFGENFLTVMLLKKHATENKYFEKPLTIQVEKFLRDYTLTQLYLNNIVAAIKIEIKDEEIEKEWLAEREKNESYQSVPIEQGLAYMRQKLTQEKRLNLKQEFIKSLFERYKVEKNPDYKKMLNMVKITAQ